MPAASSTGYDLHSAGHVQAELPQQHVAPVSLGHTRQDQVLDDILGPNQLDHQLVASIRSRVMS